MNFADFNLLSTLDTALKHSNIFVTILIVVFAVLSVSMFIKKRKKGVGNWRYEIGTMIAEFTLLGLMIIMPYNSPARWAVDIMFSLSISFDVFYN